MWWFVFDFLALKSGPCSMTCISNVKNHKQITTLHTTRDLYENET
jgi:hypothetical protein